MDDILLIEAQIAAKDARRAKGDEFAALVFLNEDELAKVVGPTTDLFDQFMAAWREFLSTIEVVGSNDKYSWGVYSKKEMVYFTGGEKAPLGIVVGTKSYYKVYQFKDPSWKYKHVFVAQYDYGMGGPHKGGRWEMVGKNPNDPDLRNGD